MKIQIPILRACSWKKNMSWSAERELRSSAEHRDETSLETLGTLQVLPKSLTLMKVSPIV
jgi:hypothetical protein